MTGKEVVTAVGGRDEAAVAHHRDDCRAVWKIDHNSAPAGLSLTARQPERDWGGRSPPMRGRCTGRAGDAINGTGMNVTIRILGIDPGLRRTGWGLIDVEGNRLRHVAHGVVKVSVEGSLAARLHELFDAVAAVVADQQPAEAAVEETYVNRNGAATLKLGYARGVALLAPALAGVPVGQHLKSNAVWTNGENPFKQDDGSLIVVIATDADVDGMHIRLLLLTFFLQFFPELIRDGHVFILQTPLFRVRNKKETIYCYDETERRKALDKLGKNAEITRFKGLGEISPDEFGFMIGPDMRLDPVEYEEGKGVKELLAFYMGKNTPERQDYIIENLREDVDKQIEAAVA